MKTKDRQFKQVEIEESDADLELLISTNAVDKEGDVVEQEWTVDGSVPFLWQHGKDVSIPPLGHVAGLRTVAADAVDVQLSEDATEATIAEIDIDKDDQFAAGVLRKYERGDMEDSSVGFDPGETEELDNGRFRFSDNRLEELSATPVGANQDTTALKELDDSVIPDALKEGRRNAKRDDKALSHAKEMIAFVRGEMGEDKIGACPFKGDGSEEMSAGETAIEKALSEADRTELAGVIDAKITRAERMAEILEDADQITRRTVRRMVDMLEKDKRANKVIHTVLGENYEIDGDDRGPARREAPSTQTKIVTDFQDLPLADRDTSWDGAAAIDSMRQAAGLDEGQPLSEADDLEMMRRGHLWRAEDAETMDDFKLPYAEVRDGTLIAIPRGIFAVAAVLEGARGGADIPQDDMDAVRAHVEQYYAKMRDEFGDDELIAPWQGEASNEPEGKKSAELPWTEDHFFEDDDTTHDGTGGGAASKGQTVPDELARMFD